MDKQIIRITLGLMMLCASYQASATSVGSGGLGTAFSKGNTTVGIVAGSGRSFNEDYLILGVGVGYYVLEGLELGVDIQHWFLGDPGITKISPQIRYVFTQPKVIKPYIGAFYRRTYISDIDDQDSFGYRLGAYFSGSNGVYIGGGIVYEEYQDCSRFLDCSDTYPEIIFSFSF